MFTENNKKIFIYFLLLTAFSLETLHAESVSALIEVRASIEASVNVSQDFLNNINSSESLNTRNSLLPETMATQGRHVPDDWVSIVKDYMRRVNRQSELSTAGMTAERQQALKEAEHAYKNSTATTAKNLMASRKEVFIGYNSANTQRIESLVAKGQTLFSSPELREVYFDLSNQLDIKDSSTTKKLLEQLSKKEEILKGLKNPELDALVEDAKKSLKDLAKLSEKAELENAAYKAALEKKLINPAQLEIEQNFFKEKKISPISKLSELTSSERKMLLDMKDSSLFEKNVNKAIEIVNKKREEARSFVFRVRDSSNEVTNAIVERRRPVLPESLSVKGQRIVDARKELNMTKNYRDMVSAKFVVLEKELGKMPGVTDIQTKISILDNYDKVKNINVKEALAKIPKEDIMGRQAFAEMVLTKGSPEERRILEIIDSPLSSATQKKIKFKLNCKKVSR